MSEPKISVIIPVYNAGKYIRECVASVQTQTMSDFELILVNDGSSDNSSALCHEMAETDTRIRVIDIDNSGPAHARNVGIDVAKGMFLAFIDSDDTVSPVFLEKMLKAAEKHEADIVMCIISNINADGVITINKFPFSSDTLFKENEIRETVLPGYFLSGKGIGLPSMVNKLYRKSWIDSIGLRLDETRVRAEDWLFNLQCLISYPRFVAIDEALYNYLQHPGSVMHTVRPDEAWQTFKSTDILLDVNNKIGGNYQVQILLSGLTSIIGHAIAMTKAGCENECTRLLASQPLRKMLNDIPVKDLFSLPRVFAAIAFMLKLRCTSGAKAIIKLI